MIHWSVSGCDSHQEPSSRHFTHLSPGGAWRQTVEVTPYYTRLSTGQSRTWIMFCLLDLAPARTSSWCRTSIKLRQVLSYSSNLTLRRDRKLRATCERQQHNSVQIASGLEGHLQKSWHLRDHPFEFLVALQVSMLTSSQVVSAFQKPQAHQYHMERNLWAVVVIKDNNSWVHRHTPWVYRLYLSFALKWSHSPLLLRKPWIRDVS